MSRSRSHREDLHGGAVPGRSLRVLQVNSEDARGGAAKVMQDLNREYTRRGIESWMAAGHIYEPSGEALRIDNDTARSRWTRAFAQAPAEGTAGRAPSSAAGKLKLVLSDPARYARILRGLEDVHFPATAGLLELPPMPPDVLHLHNLHGYYFDLRELPRLARRVPTVVTMHDAWLLTGHCAHPFDCERWRDGCGSCENLGMYPPIRRDASAHNQAFKRDIVHRSGIALASPSRWLLKMAEDSGLVGESNDARVIPNGVDTSIFHRGDRAAARAELALPPDRPVVLLSAHRLADNPFKDFATLLSALPAIAEAQDPLIVALGGEGLSAPEGTSVLPVPYVSDPARVALYYQAADVYVHPSLAENLPLALMEAMACGTAVVASEVGGVPEIVADGENGLLVPPRDPEALARAVTTLLGDPGRRSALQEAGMRTIAERFTLSRQADAYLDWYAEMLDARAQA